MDTQLRELSCLLEGVNNTVYRTRDVTIVLTCVSHVVGSISTQLQHAPLVANTTIKLYKAYSIAVHLVNHA
jgi:hypothetical protein